MPNPLQQTRIPWVLELTRTRAPEAVHLVADELAPAPAVVVPRLRKLSVVVLFDAQAIRDVLVHRPLVLLNLEMAKFWAFDADNRLDQAVTIAMVGSLVNDPANAGDVGLSSTLAANTRQPVINGTWAPYVGLTVTAPVAPTSGSITIRGQVQVEE